MTLLTLLTTFILLIKFFSLIISVFIFNSILVKFFILTINILVIWYIYTKDKRDRRVLSKLRAKKYRLVDKYPLKTKWQHIVNVVVLITYPLIFICGILWLRFSNINKSIDVLYYYYEIENLTNNSTLPNIVISLLLLVSVFILYLKLLSVIKNYFKFQYVRRHLYESDDYNLYRENPKTLFAKFMNIWNKNIGSFFTLFFYLENKISIDSLSWTIGGYIYRFFDLKSSKNASKLANIIKKFFFIMHHIFSFLLLYYDIVFNHFIIEKIFIFLPFIFIYDLIVKFNKFYEELEFGYDNIIYALLYERITQEFNYYRLGNCTVEPETLKRAVEYARAGLFVNKKKLEEDEEKDYENFRKEYGIEEPEYIKVNILIEKNLKILKWLNIIFLIIMIIFGIYYIYINNF